MLVLSLIHIQMCIRDSIGPAAEELYDKIIELIETEIKYEGYISKAMDQVAKMKRMEEKRIPANIDWDDIDSIATEARQKFKLINPETIGQASRISGVNPADISILMVYLEGKNRSISKNQEKKAQRKTAPKTGLFYDLFFIWCEDHWDDDRFTFCIFIEEGANCVDNGTIDGLYAGVLVFQCDTNCIEEDALALANQEMCIRDRRYGSWSAAKNFWLNNGWY